jgi:anti-anti-sigma regulatory factor
MNQQPQQILVGENGPNVFIRLIGRGYFQNSAALRQYLEDQILRKKSKIDLDLSECTGMDSTFLGTLAGIAMKLQQCGEGLLTIRNLTALTRRQLTLLGVDRLECVHLLELPPSPIPEEITPIDQKPDQEGDVKKKTAEIMLDAHENLMKISPQNEAEFKDLAEVLRNRLKRFNENES